MIAHIPGAAKKMGSIFLAAEIAQIAEKKKTQN
jgi:hypothetical protein